ncbi:MAG: DUF1732 domain-containing protein, partial [Muribaculaceae bacterium]|nr:DUF1732 domain-containing protein [Muribaculaceae bacterium]
MLMSMTGFGRYTVELTGKKITVEIKSLNSKQMDLSVRIPSIFRSREIEMRTYVASVLQRGKADLNVSVETIGGSDTLSHINDAVAAAYKKQIEDMAHTLGLPEPQDWYSVLLRMPEVLHANTVEEATEAENEALLTALHEAVGLMMAHRRAEGEKLEKFFRERISAIGDLLEKVGPFEGERIERIRTKLEENLTKIPVADLDKGRLEQEMIFYIEKLDVNEEKQRLSQHLNYFIETMNAPE